MKENVILQWMIVFLSESGFLAFHLETLLFCLSAHDSDRHLSRFAVRFSLRSIEWWSRSFAKIRPKSNCCVIHVHSHHSTSANPIHLVQISGCRVIMPMFIDGPTVNEKLDVSKLIDVISDVLQRFSKGDPSVQQPLRTILPIGEREKYRSDWMVIEHRFVFSFLIDLPCIDTQRGYTSVKTITSFPASRPAIDGLVSLFSSETGRLLLVSEWEERTEMMQTDLDGRCQRNHRTTNRSDVVSRHESKISGHRAERNAFSLPMKILAFSFPKMDDGWERKGLSNDPRLWSPRTGSSWCIP